MSRSVIVSGNCQITGIAQALRLIFPDDTITSYPFQVDNGQPPIEDLVGDADVWIAMSERESETPSAWQALRRVRHVVPSSVNPNVLVIKVPFINFNGFHPDLVYAVNEGGDIFRGAAGDYHSAIGLWAWRRGLEPRDAAALFAARTFERLGYYSYYDTALKLLEWSWGASDLDFGRFWMRAKRLGVFMHTVNHPRIRVLTLLGTQIALEMGAPPQAMADPLDDYLEDPLIGSGVWPVYPAIAQRLGVPGSYRFRIGDVFHPSLLDFLEAQWAAYAGTDPASIRAVRDDDGLYDSVLQDALTGRA